MKFTHPLVWLALACSFSAPALAWDVGASKGGNSPSDQVLIHKSAPAGSGVYATRRLRKSWNSARILPRKPRKKLNPDSMAVNG